MWEQSHKYRKQLDISINKPENDWRQCRSPEGTLDDLEKKMQTSTGQMKNRVIIVMYWLNDFKHIDLMQHI